VDAETAKTVSELMKYQSRRLGLRKQKVPGIPWYWDNFLQFLDDYPPADWPRLAAETVAIARDTLNILRENIADPDQPGISWTSPWLEAQFPVEWDRWDPADIQALRMGYVRPELREAIQQAEESCPYLTVLQDLTARAVHYKHPDGMELILSDGEVLPHPQPDDASDQEEAETYARYFGPRQLPGLVLPFDPKADYDTDKTCEVSIAAYPLVIDAIERRAYYPLSVMIPVHYWETPPWAAGDEAERYFWDATFELIAGAYDLLREMEQRSTPGAAPGARGGVVGAVPPPERRRSVMGPIPMPRDVPRDANALALTRGLGRMFTEYHTIPDLDLEGDVATSQAVDLFWEMLEQALSQAIPRTRKGVPWERTEEDGKTVITLRGMAEADARQLWGTIINTMNKGSGGPGLRVAAPAFEPKSYFDIETRQAAKETRIVLWPDEVLKDEDGWPVSPVRFRSEGSPGYLALLDQHGSRPFFADGWLWLPRGGEREGFRIGGLPRLLFPEGRAAIERLERRNLEDSESRLSRIFHQPSLFQDDDARMVRDLQVAVRRVKRRLRTLTVYEVSTDLVLSIFEAWFRQRDEWINERMTLRDGRVIETRPWRIIRLEPDEIRIRLDPGDRWGHNWRNQLFEKLEALTTFERQTRSRAGRKIDVGDRLLMRVIDGRRGVEEGSAPDTDSGLGLTRLLKRAGAFPIDAFLAEVSIDFMERLVTWAVDEQGVVHWGIDSAKAAQQLALHASPQDAKAAQEAARSKREEVRSKPYYEHSPRLLTLANLENWPWERKNLAYTLLQEVTPHRQAVRTKEGATRTRRARNVLGGKEALVTIDGQDYVACNGSMGNGYRVETWIDKVGYKRRSEGGVGQCFADFVRDLRALLEAIGLRIELKRPPRTGDEPPASPARADREALTALEGYLGKPSEAYSLRLRLFLPMDREDRLRRRLAEAGIDAIDEEEEDSFSVISPQSSDGLSAADVRKARVDLDWKQTDLARAVGVSQKEISMWESAKKAIPRDRIAQLREILDLNT
jgi:DNA-binding transcriptional regulator YiaG